MPSAAPALVERSTPVRADVRVDLQGLRALAVTLVVVFHVWPLALPGGYIGVDVFFVLSGFLITAHLLREAERTGQIRLGRFWARRARRLLPAALVVLLATVIGVWCFAPVGYVDRFLHEIVWSTVYVENWALAASSVDYLAAEATASPVQHYWSLSVEEQFYLLWPLLVLLGLWVAGKSAARRSVGPRRVLAILLGLVVLASFVWSVVATALDAAPAYFITTTRAWEFGAGGLLAVMLTGRGAGRSSALPAWARTSAAWMGLAMIVGSAIGYSAATPFPGWAAALPVVGTLLVVWADGPSGRFAPDRLLGLRPVQALGDRSYAVYLWHWPIIVLGTFALGRSATLSEQLVLLAATLALSIATTRWIERPVRFGAASRLRPRTALAAAGAVMVVVVAVTMIGVPVADARVASARQELGALVSDPPACFGAAALLDAQCVGANAAADSGTTLADRPIGSLEDPSIADDPPERCIAETLENRFLVCSFGVSAAAAAVRTVALIGDSHAEQWLPALSAAAEANRWRVVVIAKSSCPFSGAVRTEPGMSATVRRLMNASCTRWNDETMAYLAAHQDVDTVLLAARGRNPVVPTDGEPWRTTAERAYVERWKQIPSSVRNIVVLRDTPRMPDAVLACVRDAEDPARDCSRGRSEALEDDPQFDAALGVGASARGIDGRVSTLDLSDAFCTTRQCAPVVGGVLVYRDSHHLNWVYAATTAPALAERLTAVTGGALSAR